MASGAELTPRAREIVTAARELLEEEGPEALSMRRLGERLGIRAPSIYKHLPGKDALEAAVISDGFEEFAATLDGVVVAQREELDPRAGRRGDDPGGYQRAVGVHGVRLQVERRSGHGRADYGPANPRNPRDQAASRLAPGGKRPSSSRIVIP